MLRNLIGVGDGLNRSTVVDVGFLRDDFFEYYYIIIDEYGMSPRRAIRHAI